MSSFHSLKYICLENYHYLTNTTRYDYSPFLIACFYGNLSKVISIINDNKIMVSNFKNIDQTNLFKPTCVKTRVTLGIELACENGHEIIEKYLINYSKSL